MRQSRQEARSSGSGGGDEGAARRLDARDVGQTLTDGFERLMRNLEDQMELTRQTLDGPWTPRAVLESWRRSAELHWETYCDVTEPWLRRAGWPVPGGPSSTWAEEPYIGYSGYPAVPPPYGFRAVELQGYILRADTNRISELLDRRINRVLRRAGVRFRYQPLAGPAEGGGKHTPVFVQVANYRRFFSKVPEYREYGVFSQNELCFLVPLVKMRGDLPLGLALFSPYYFVDDDWSVFAGREILGLDKRISAFRRTNKNMTTTVKSYLFKKYGVDARTSSQQVAIVRRRSGPKRKSDAIHPRFGPYEELFAERGLFAVEADLYDFVAEEIRSGQYALLGLKQSRDADGPNRASYQAVVEAGVADVELRQANLIGPASVELPGYDSLKIASELGLGPGRDGRYEAVLPYEIEFDWDIDDCEEVVAAGRRRGS